MFGRKKEPKKRKGCLGRIFSFFVFIVVAGLAYDFFFGDNLILGDDVDYISDEEISSGEEDISYEDMLTSFYDFYGYLPDDSNGEDYYYSDYYDESEYSDDFWSSLLDSLFDDGEPYYSSYSDDDSDYLTYNDSYDDDYSYSNDSSDYYSSDDTDYNDDYGDNKSDSSSFTDTSRNALAKFVEVAKSYMGTPYVWGGNTRSGIDCSGLIHTAALESGLGNLPRTAKTLCGIASRIDKSDLSSGDLVFFSSGGSVSHVAIYIGNNQILHAVSEGSKTGVITSKLSQKYWKDHYYSSGRIMSESVAKKRSSSPRSRSVIKQ